VHRAMNISYKTSATFCHQEIGGETF
jgi:hypothetical protein